MSGIIELETERLLLRQWRNEDLAIFARINADPEVMEFYPDVLSTAESDDIALKFKSLITIKGWGFWALETKSDNSFIGFVGLHEPTYELPVTPCVEIGWRLAKEHWGNGYATEAARASLDVAFLQLNLPQIYSFTPVQNKRSRAVMERIHMKNTDGNFNHPLIPEHSLLREHVLYKITQQSWLENRMK